MTGQHLSHYRIDAELGRGGMGIVYRATDTKLDRTVALKVLPPHALSSQDDRARFYREAKAAAQLHHPNIATVFQVDEAEVEGTLRPFIAMEFIDGESLSARIARGPLKLPETLRIASEIATALKAAHAKDIVHRDIKSANVMLTSEGVAKVLDFGLAKTNASTMLTRQGSTLGTVAYMSPEQARGEEVDGRTDLWALGVVIYEMLTGSPPFAADYEQAALYGILNEEPEPVTAIRTGVPMEFESIVSKLLRKDAGTRYQSSAGLLADLDALVLPNASTLRSATSRRSLAVDTSLARPSASKWRLYAIWMGVVGVLLGALGSAALLRGGSSPRTTFPGDVLRASIQLPEEYPVLLATGGMGTEGVSLDISRDGATMVYVARVEDRQQLVLRDMYTGEFRLLDQTNAAQNPSFSPDGRSVAYVTENGIYSVALDGSRPQFLTEHSNAAGITWGWDGAIYLADVQGSALVRYSPEGGREIIDIGRRCSCAMPHLAPLDMGLVVSGRDREQAFVYRGAALDSLAIRGNHVKLLTAGLAVFSRTGVLLASRWNPRTGDIGSDVVTIVDDIRTGTISRAGQYGISDSGTLVYVSGSPSGLVKLVIREASGDETAVPLPVGVYGPVHLSPDENRLLVTSYDAGGKTILLNLDSGDQRFVAPDAEPASAFWHSNGLDISYVTRRDGRWQIRLMNPDRSGPGSLVVESDEGIQISNWSSDGAFLAYEKRTGAGAHLVIRSVADSTEHEIAVDEHETVWAAEFAPNRPYFAYTMVGTGGSRVYVQGMGTGADSWLISPSQGEEPQWVDDGDGLVFRANRGWYRADVDWSGPSPVFGTPELLFDGPYVNIAGMEYRMMNGGRALLQKPVNTEETANRVEVISNVFVALDGLLEEDS